jgi:hypothetical protein
MEALIASIIGGLAVIFAALIPFWVKRKKKDEPENSEYLLGDWGCEWWDNGKKCADDDMPLVRLNKIADGNVFGKGRDKNGSFEIQGQLIGKNLALTGSRPDGSGGKIDLNINNNKLSMNGWWEWSDDPNSKAYGGETKWIKKV